MSLHNPLQTLLPAWESFHAITDIGPIRDEEHCQRMTDLVLALLAETGDDEQHSAMGLVDILSDLIEDYESERIPSPEATGIQALEFLMEQHGLRPCDLPEIGDPGAASAILAGQRELDAGQMRALARRFLVTPATFV